MIISLNRPSKMSDPKLKSQAEIFRELGLGVAPLSRNDRPGKGANMQQLIEKVGENPNNNLRSSNETNRKGPKRQVGL